ncbi:hypothetical protein AXF42_Ash011305 [Apostasia shenzhenica]|uniref:Uncharacterized protein n=1 Tax=Apostasia shenzhenica TaxID=1088818 RepID=A0A2I0AE95_9ASPA|nr:hypothetical protein AXF42_Ash011305 [Apostasia shenzhenica]
MVPTLHLNCTRSAKLAFSLYLFTNSFIYSHRSQTSVKPQSREFNQASSTTSQDHPC